MGSEPLPPMLFVQFALQSHCESGTGDRGQVSSHGAQPAGSYQNRCLQSAIFIAELLCVGETSLKSGPIIPNGKHSVPISRERKRKPDELVIAYLNVSNFLSRKKPYPYNAQHSPALYHRGFQPFLIRSTPGGQWRSGESLSNQSMGVGKEGGK